MVKDFDRLFGRANGNSEELIYENAVIRNQNVRIAKVRGDRLESDPEKLYTHMIYALLNNDTILITTNEEAFVEILGRLATSQFVQ